MKKIFTLIALALATTAIQAQEKSYTMRVIISGVGTYPINTETIKSVRFEENTVDKGEIEAGTDLTTFFADTQKAFGDNKSVAYKLKAGTYTMSGDIVVPDGVTLGLTGNEDGTNITMSADASFVTNQAINLFNLNINCAASTKPLISMSTTPNAADLGVVGTSSQYDIINCCYLYGLNISGLKERLITDNGVKYSFTSLDIDDCVIQTEFTSTLSKAFIDLSTWGANTLSISNSTFYNTTDYTTNRFIWYNNSCRNDRNGYAYNYVLINNCTFYKMFINQHIMNHNIAGRSTSIWEMQNCIFAESGNGQIARRFLNSRGNQATATFANNTYARTVKTAEGTDSIAYDDPGNYDQSGTAITSYPVFKNAAAGDFTLDSSCEQYIRETGDPRWLKEVENTETGE